uniref:F-box domain-containing protein n=1 Tax=Pithovirus LCPAC304 TaxID=2506594 RepID=A0A481Z766_9VIRU|nr:MAG: hypothetical protein LCPAC304_00240 [Pithovirus LCPAC304]
MEGRELATLDEELLVQILERMNYHEISRWCATNRRFRRLCERNHQVRAIIEQKEGEEGVAQIYLDKEELALLKIMVMMIQTATHFTLMMPKSTLLELLEVIERRDQGLFREEAVHNISIAFFKGYLYEFKDQYVARITSGEISVTILASQFEHILRVALEMDEQGFDLDADVEGHVILFVDGSTAFVPH